MSFTARFWGTCPHCLEAIKPGDAVHYEPDPMGFMDGDRVVHDDCNDTQMEDEAEVCTRCFLERPCPCDDEQVAS